MSRMANPDDGNGAAREPASDYPQYELARGEELRRLEHQRDELDSMRTRASQYLAFVGAATAFLVGNGLENADRDALFYAIAAFASLISATAIYLGVAVFLGGGKLAGGEVGKYAFTLNSLVVLRTVEADVPHANPSQVSAYMTRLYAEMADGNAPVLAAARRQYRWFLGTGASQVLGWTILLWARG